MTTDAKDKSDLKVTVGTATYWRINGSWGSNEVGHVLSDLLDHIATLTQQCDSLAKERNGVIEALGCTRDDAHSPWWLPGDPSPVECATLADVVRAAHRLADNDVKRTEAERDALRLAVAAWWRDGDNLKLYDTAFPTRDFAPAAQPSTRAANA